MRAASIASVLLLLTACQQQPSERKEKDAAAPSPAAQIVPPEWVKVTVNTENGGVYINAKSILPYKDGGLMMAEMAMERPDKSFNGMVEGFDCKNRLRSDLGLDGTNSSPSPVVTWQIFSQAFNYVCFNHVQPEMAKEPHLKDLNITYVPG